MRRQKKKGPVDEQKNVNMNGAFHVLKIVCVCTYLGRLASVTEILTSCHIKYFLFSVVPDSVRPAARIRELVKWWNRSPTGA